ncbi:MAG: polysaccharide deacetylase family protein [Pirellulales bacterium]
MIQLLAHLSLQSSLRRLTGITLRALLLAAAVAALAGQQVSAWEDEPTQTWAERLGYPAGKRVLILHADDIGMCYEANEAAKRYLSAGDIQSAAMMVPCPWFNEIAHWYKEHPEHDCGLHLAMNSEWKWYRWPPVAPASEVPGMIDPDGYLWDDTIKTALKAPGAQVEKEIRAQLERAISRGIRPSHIDTHMGTLYARPDYTAAYCKVAEEYRIPAMVVEVTPKIEAKFRQRGIPDTSQTRKLLATYKLPKLDDFDAVVEGKTYEEKLDKFYEQIRGLDPGITELIFHPSILTEGLKHITGSWQQRAWEAEMFSDPAVKEFLNREGIVFTNWKEMMSRWEERFGKDVESPKRLDK